MSNNISFYYWIGVLFGMKTCEIMNCKRFNREYDEQEKKKKENIRNGIKN